MARILFLGSASAFSLGVLSALGDTTVDLVLDSEAWTSVTGVDSMSATVVRSASAALPLVQPGSLESIAMSRRWRVARLPASRLQEGEPGQGQLEQTNSLAQLEKFFAGADLVLVACHGALLPADLLARVPLGVYNLHPSVLPRYRGPVPVFWQLRDGLADTGVTLHEVGAKLDAGPIVGQISMPVGLGEAEATISARLGELGGRLFEQYLPALLQGGAKKTIQDETVATYQSWPAPADFAIGREWSVERAVRFIRGVQARGVPITVASRSSAPARADMAARSGIAIERVLDWTHERFPAATTATRIELADGELAVRLFRSS